ncbi:MAG: helicase-related protein [Planctomycetota bacterium]
MSAWFGALLEAYADSRWVAWTATPYRLDGGFIYGPGRRFTNLAHRVSPRELIELGYLSPPRMFNRERGAIDVEGVRTQAGDFVGSELSSRARAEGVVEAAVAEIVEACAERESILIFAIDVAHAHEVAEEIRRQSGERVEVVAGATPIAERERTIGEFRAGRLRWVVNVAVMTTGVDVPRIDAIVLLRPTESRCLYVQMVGRGLRLHEGKSDCLVLDFGGNALRHGPIDSPYFDSVQGSTSSNGKAHAKACGPCGRVSEPDAMQCGECGARFPERVKPKRTLHGATAAGGALLSTDDDPALFEVLGVEYFQNKNSKTKNRTMRVEYALRGRGRAVEYLSFDAPWQSTAKKIASSWWKSRSEGNAPRSVEEALQRVDELRRPSLVRVTEKSGFDRIKVVAWVEEVVHA